MAKKRSGIRAQPHESHMTERELASIPCQHRPARRQNGVEKANDADMHDVVVVASRIDKGKGEKKRQKGDSHRVGDMSFT